MRDKVMIHNFTKWKSELFNVGIAFFLSLLISTLMVFSSSAPLSVRLIPLLALFIIGLFFYKPFVNIFLFFLLLRPAVDMLDLKYAGYFSPNILIGSFILIVGSFAILHFKRLHEIPILKSLAIFMGIAIIPTLLKSPFFTNSLYIWLRTLTYIPLFLIAYYLVRYKQLPFKTINIVLILSAVLPAIVSGIQYMFGMGKIDPYLGIARPLGTFVHANSLGLYITFSQILIISLIAGKIREKDKKCINWILALFILNILVIYITKSRISWIIFVICIFSLLFIIYKSFSKRIVLSILFALIISTLYLLSPTIQSRFSEIFTAKVSSNYAINSVAWRIKQWKEIYQLFKQSPVIGNGFGIDVYITKFYSHNDYLGIMASIGIIGFVVYCYVYLNLIRIFGRFKTDFPVISAVVIVLILAVALASLTDNIFRMTPIQWFFWAYVGSALGHIKTKQTNDD
jgi:O-antigen ligase